MTYALSLRSPQPWRAGSVGNEPIYFGCCECNPEGRGQDRIAGFLSTTPEYSYEHIVVRENESGFFTLALYCESCWSAYLAANLSAVA